jgi:hypothetical protein
MVTENHVGQRQVRIEITNGGNKNIIYGVRIRLRVMGVNTIPHISRLLVTLAILLTVLTSRATESVVTPAMVGHWEGNARIGMTWCHQTNLPVKVDIHADGSVTGTVGDAKLTDGRFQRNRGWLLRKLNWATDYIIKGGMDGAIVAAEGITRSSVKMPLNFSNGTFVGGVNTSGSHFGGKKSMWLAAGSLKLVRSQ